MMQIKDAAHVRQIRFGLPRERVLLVGENAKDLEYFAARLQRNGYCVRAFTNYREAVECLEQEHFDRVVVRQSNAKGLV